MNLLTRQLGALFLVFGAIGSLTAELAAQKYRTEEVPDAGVQITAPSRLERLPMRFGENGIHHRARLTSKDPQDYVRNYAWQADVYVFPKLESEDGGVATPKGLSPDQTKAFRAAMAKFGRKSHKSFKSWLDSKKKVEIVKAGKAVRGKNGKLDYTHWVWRYDNGWGPTGICWCEAAVYTFEDKESALIIEIPLEKASGKPKSKWKNIIKKMIRSGKELEEEEVADASDLKNDKRAKFADTPAKLKAVEKAMSNIAGLKGWDFFTQPNYVVLYSWDFEKSDEESKARKQAEYYGDRLEKMRELYIGNYPLDASGTKAVWPDPATIPDLGGPITGPKVDKPKKLSPEEKAKADKERAEKVVETPYSVFRLCATYDQFRKYGQSPPGVVGWYSPASKELVVFLGGDKMMGKGATETVTYHEGWHQYADHYFHHPDSPKHASLHRWFDEGHGDYFGSFRWGGSKWKYVGSDMRYGSCKQMVQQGDYVPFKEIVYWSRAKFYGGNAPYYYAQAFSMVDFLRRGQDSKGFKEQWGEALDMYRKVTLVKGDTKLAVDTAFRGFKDEDWTELEEAWKAWVQSRNFKKG